MKAKNKKFIQLMYVTVTVLLLGMLLVSVAQANPLAQDPRPPVDDGGGGNGGGNGGGSGGTAGAGSGGSGSGSSTSACASLSGQVINWGFGPQEGVGIALKTGSWQTSTTSASEGQYGLGGLGVGVAKLDVSVAPALSGELEPAIEDAGVYLTCEFPTVANLAVSSAEIDPPATIEMTGPTSLTASSSVPLRLTVENSLPNEITNVIVTDLMPPGLVALEVKAAAVDESNARIIDAGTDGQLVVVYLDKLAAGEETNIFITVTVAEEVPANTAVTNRATLFYRESVAAQSALDLTVSGSTLAIPAAVASISQDEAEAEDMAEEAFVPPDEAPTTGGELVTEAAAEENGAKEAFVAPDDMPSTGGEITVIVEPDPADTLLVDDAAPLAVEAGDISPVGKSAAAKVDITAAESPASGPSPVTFFSAMVLLVILIGLGSFRFANRRSRLADETTE